MASGALPSPPGMKFFLYAHEENGGALFLVQMVIITASGDVTVSLKSSTQDQTLIHGFCETLKSGLAEFSPSYA
jgi:hypothetical protein